MMEERRSWRAGHVAAATSPTNHTSAAATRGTAVASFTFTIDEEVERGSRVVRRVYFTTSAAQAMPPALLPLATSPRRMPPRAVPLARRYRQCYDSRRLCLAIA